MPKEKDKSQWVLTFIMYMQQREPLVEQKEMPQITNKHVDYWLNEFATRQ